MYKGIDIVSEAGTQQDMHIDKLSNIDIASHSSEIVRTFPSDHIFNEGGSAEQSSQVVTQNADI